MLDILNKPQIEYTAIDSFVVFLLFIGIFLLTVFTILFILEIKEKIDDKRAEKRAQKYDITFTNHKEA